MRVSGFWSAVGLVIAGLILADLLTHPAGTKQVSSGLTSITSTTGNQLLGK
jgi:hypothetical protein